MYYAEEVINGILMFKTTPKGAWTEVPYATILHRMLKAEKRAESEWS